MRALLVDSSVWIAASDSRNKECFELKKLIKNNAAISIIRPIQVEVCQGARSDEIFHQLWEYFLGMHILEVTDRHWGMSAWNYFKCRRKGITLTTLDSLIATISKEYQIPLWTLDKTLLKSKSVIGFDIY